MPVDTFYATPQSFGGVISPVLIRPADVVPLHLDARTDAAVEQGWQALQHYRTITQNDTLLRVVSADSGRVEVVADITYRHVVGARYCQAVAQVPYVALSAMAVPITSDGQLVLRRRDSGDWPLSYECIGGFVRQRFGYETVDDFIADRIANEMPRCPVATLTLAGYYQLPSIAEGMYVYIAGLGMTAGELHECNGGDEYVTIPLTTDARCFAAMSLLSLPIHTPTERVLHALWGSGVFPVATHE